jgi:hypothetical protein
MLGLAGEHHSSGDVEHVSPVGFFAGIDAQPRLLHNDPPRQSLFLAACPQSTPPTAPYIANALLVHFADLY